MTTTPSPAGLGPLVLVREPQYLPHQVNALRDLVTRHDDTAWLNARPPTGKTTLPALSKDLLDASGVVGLRTPRTAGERHTLRVLPHWIHGPIRHVVLAGAHDLQPESIEDTLASASVAGVTVWLVTHGIAPKRNWTQWASTRCSGRTLNLPTALSLWGRRHAPRGLCSPPAGTWWEQPGWWKALERCTVHDSRARCVLSWIRRGSGTPRPSAARELLTALLGDPDTTVADRWALCDASRDHYTPAQDAIVQLGLYDSERTLEVRDVSRDASRLVDRHHPNGAVIVSVPEHMRPALARQRSAQLWAGCSPRTPLLGIDGEEAWIAC